MLYEVITFNGAGQLISKRDITNVKRGMNSVVFDGEKAGC